MVYPSQYSPKANYYYLDVDTKDIVINLFSNLPVNAAEFLLNKRT